MTNFKLRFKKVLYCCESNFRGFVFLRAKFAYVIDKPAKYILA